MSIRSKRTALAFIAVGHPHIALDSPRRMRYVAEDHPSCRECGTIMVRNGSHFKCLNCGATADCS
ncbi:MAG: hypothetical protein AAB539_02280 [Patescibacteria group bacterium]